MKTFLLLSLVVTGLCVRAQAEEWKWFLAEVTHSGWVYDGRGLSLDIDAGKLFPVSREMTWAELEADQRRDLPKANAYFVVPMASGYSAVVVAGAGRWVNPRDPALSAQVQAWARFDARTASEVRAWEAQRRGPRSPNMAEPYGQTSSQRYYERKDARDEKARRDAVAAAEVQAAQAQAAQARELRRLRQAVDSLPKAR